MPEFEIDFSDVGDEPKYETLPKGTYNVHVEQIELKDSQSSEYQYLNWTLVVDEPEEFKGRRLWHITSFAPQSINRMKALFESFGVMNGTQLSLKVDDDTSMLIEPDLIDASAVAKVTHRMYEGEPKAKVQRLVGVAVVKPGAGPIPTTGGDPTRRQFK